MDCGHSTILGKVLGTCSGAENWKKKSPGCTLVGLWCPEFDFIPEMISLRYNRRRWNGISVQDATKHYIYWCYEMDELIKVQARFFPRISFHQWHAPLSQNSLDWWIESVGAIGTLVPWSSHPGYELRKRIYSEVLVLLVSWLASKLVLITKDGCG